MLVKDLIEYLSTLKQDDELLFGDYYYEDRMGFESWVTNPTIDQYIVRPKDSLYNKFFPENVYLVDLNMMP